GDASPTTRLSMTWFPNGPQRRISERRGGDGRGSLTDGTNREAHFASLQILRPADGPRVEDAQQHVEVADGEAGLGSEAGIDHEVARADHVGEFEAGVARSDVADAVERVPIESPRAKV